MCMKDVRQYVLAMKGIQDNPNAIRFCEHFLEVAQSFKTVKWDLSKEFAEIYGCEAQLCFENCQLIAARLPDLRYSEGYVVSHGGSVEDHAWLIDETGEVIDPTLVLHMKLRERVEGYVGLAIPSDYIEGLYLEDARRDTRIEQAFADGLW